MDFPRGSPAWLLLLLLRWVLLSQAALSSSSSSLLTPLGSRRSSCKAIPSGLALCHGVGYGSMRLPNLLGHDTMREALQQAGSWLPLLAKRCHRDTKKFLCSLFAPVCLPELEEAVYPCRSLCRGVRDGCAPVMAAFGFPWPAMFNCSRFPAESELCVPPGAADGPPGAAAAAAAADPPCAACQGPGDSEKEFMENVCNKDFALKLSVHSTSSEEGHLKVIPEVKSRALYKQEGWTEEELRKTVLWLTDGDSCTCEEIREQGATFLVLGQQVAGKLVISWLRKWERGEKELKKFSRLVRRVQC
ncbi:secreted frizzled-related protein 2-like [Rhinatrema bivittatum]|uniref:secreted frizzled-related protein 2-like n=1 Tax=Rhinatrema bivittatum TaxID=194408 RepID=UPI00112AE1A2|nr:secreted frizzled-related protein 2-like [Rhinatrema bivittatum]